MKYVTGKMQSHTFLGWADREVILILDALKIIPDKNPFSMDDDEEFSFIEFINTNDGFNYIEDELNKFNTKYDIHLILTRIYEVEDSTTYILVLDYFLNVEFDISDTDPIQIWSINYSSIRRVADKFARVFELFNSHKKIEPSIIQITDCSNLFNIS